MHHGRKKTSLVGPSKDFKSKLIHNYNELKDKVLNWRSSNYHINNASEAFHGTTLLLNENPELYTVWNYRRRLILDESDVQLQSNLIENDLKWILNSVLTLNPKSYWIWSYRRWCLDCLNTSKHFDAELKLINQFLTLDPRNFHAWGYRQYIVSKQISSPTSLSSTSSHSNELYSSEFHFTTLKINSCMNNYSAWHYRSTILFDWVIAQKSTFSEIFDKELDLIHNAMFTDPMGQSHWLYHRWLMTKAKVRVDLKRMDAIVNAEIALLLELESEDSDCKWVTGCLAFLYEFNNNTQLKNECVHKLQKMDPDRLHYYQTLLN